MYVLHAQSRNDLGEEIIAGGRDPHAVIYGLSVCAMGHSLLLLGQLGLV